MIDPLDKEQIKREAEGVLDNEPFYIDAGTLAHYCLALLAELEQAERESEAHAERHSDAVEQIKSLIDTRDEAEARLAKVPALVEVLRQIERSELCTDQAHVLARAALADYEAA